MQKAFGKLSLFLFILIFLAANTASAAKVEWNIQPMLKTEAMPIDLTVSADGKMIYVLTDDGKIQIYDSEGTLIDTIKVVDFPKSIVLPFELSFPSRVPMLATGILTLHSTKRHCRTIFILPM